MTSSQAVEQHVTINPAAHMGAITLAVADLARSIAFYHEKLGMKAIDRADGRATMGVGSTLLLHLIEQQGAIPQPPRTTGLYHVAILLPSRADLGRVLLNLIAARCSLQGASDHRVSEAVYLADPDGNGLEIYRDRPRDEWEWNRDHRVQMDTLPLDIDGVIGSVETSGARFAGMPEGTQIGHVHLRVGDTVEAEAFYHGTIGFDVVAAFPGALFVSAGGYHHHLGLNTWQSRNAPRPPHHSTGLREFVILVPDDAARDAITDRVRAAGVAVEQDGAAARFDDPWGNRIRLAVER